MSARRRTRTDERGAALFIVMMVTTLLGAVGVFAVRASSQVELASGYSRLWAQAGYVSELALRTVAADMAGREDQYFQRMAAGTSECRAVKGLYLAGAVPVGARIPCLSLDDNELQRRAEAYSGSTFSSTEPLFKHLVRPGALTSAEGAARVELTDLGPAPNLKAGLDLKGDTFQYKLVTMTSIGQVRPLVTDPDAACAASTVQASGVQAVRSHVTFMSGH